MMSKSREVALSSTGRPAAKPQLTKIPFFETWPIEVVRLNDRNPPQTSHAVKLETRAMKKLDVPRTRT
jgi:hypothetical protein